MGQRIWVRACWSTDYKTSDKAHGWLTPVPAPFPMVHPDSTYTRPRWWTSNLLQVYPPLGTPGSGPNKMLGERKRENPNTSPRKNLALCGRWDECISGESHICITDLLNSPSSKKTETRVYLKKGASSSQGTHTLDLAEIWGPTVHMPLLVHCHPWCDSGI